MAIDYDSYLASDTSLQAALSAIQAQERADAAQQIAAQRQLVIPYGAVPDFSRFGDVSGRIGDIGSALDDTTRNLAAQATAAGISTYAQDQQAARTNYANMISELGGRGMIRSGALLSHGRDVTNRANATEFNSLQALLNALGGSYTSYLGTLGARRTEKADATNAALQRILAQIGAGLIPVGGGDTGRVSPPPLSSGITNPNVPQVPVIEGGERVYEPKQYYEPGEPTPWDFAPVAAPPPINFLQNHPSDAYRPVASAPQASPKPAAPHAPNYWQVKRNSY